MCPIYIRSFLCVFFCAQACFFLHAEAKPKALLNLAVKATSLIGNGLYGVDIKQRGKKFYIIEINDNPNLDEGVEDQLIKQNLYTSIMQEFMNRLL